MTYDEIKEAIVSASDKIKYNTIILQDGVNILLNRMEPQLTPAGQNMLSWLLKYAEEQDRLNYRYAHIIKEFEDEFEKPKTCHVCGVKIGEKHKSICSVGPDIFR